LSLTAPPESRPEEREARKGTPTAEGGVGPFGFLFFFVLAVLIVFGFVRPFVAEPLSITSASMDPTLQAGDSVLATKFAYRFADPERGDVVLFEAPFDGAPTIKRVVGVAGDTVAVRDGVLFVNGEKTREDYVDYNLTDATFFGPTDVPEGGVYVMGDNRANSLDSRSYGPVPEEDVLGGIGLRIWPLGRMGTV
jgi:signal peptidase I